VEMVGYIFLYFIPFLLITPLYLFVRICFSFTFRRLQILRYSTFLFLSLGSTFYLSKDAIESGPGALFLLVLTFPPTSMVVYILGAISVILMELMVFSYHKVQKTSSSVTKDNIPENKGLVKFGVFSIIIGIFLPILISGILLILAYLDPEIRSRVP
jgi:hypothetical protein